MPTIHTLITEAAKTLQLQLTPEEFPSRIAEILLAHLLHVPRSHLLAHPEQHVSAKINTQFNHAITQACMGKPLAYLLGQQEFYGLTLKVNAATLIPRPETELLVEHTLTHYGTTENIKILDLGTGSGAIALALATARPHWHIMATDISAGALAIAQENQKQLKLANIHLLQSDWFSAIPENQRFHAIVSNPPYIDPHDPAVSPSVREFEPHGALFCHDHGLQHLKHIIAHAKTYLYPHGLLAVEHGYQQHEIVHDLFRTHAYQNIHFLYDEQNIIRICCGTT